MPSASVIRCGLSAAASANGTRSRYCTLAPLRGGGGGGRRPPPIPPIRVRRAAAEQAFEDVAEIEAFGAAEAFEILRRKAARAAGPGRKPPLPMPNGIAGLPSASISPRSNLRALVVVGQQVIGLGHVGKALRRLGIVGVAVGVQLLGELAVGGLDVLLARAARHAQGCIRIGHGVSAKCNSLRAQAALSYIAHRV